jgi:hypothetical protein
MEGKNQKGGCLMRFEVYCDEAQPDLFFSKHPKARFLMIGSLWIPGDLRQELKHKINAIREHHNTWGEIKWSKVSPSRLPFYLELVDLFNSYGLNARFRCIAVDHAQVDMTFHEHDKELGFYKFYYQLLHHWILGFNEYDIYCDAKTNRDSKRLPTLRQCLGHANVSSHINGIQSLPSRQVALIQICDLLLGAAGSRLNNTLHPGSAKEAVVKRLESQLGISRLGPTSLSAEKFNVFQIKLQGGW